MVGAEQRVADAAEQTRQWSGGALVKQLHQVMGRGGGGEQDQARGQNQSEKAQPGWSAGSCGRWGRNVLKHPEAGPRQG